MNSSVINTYIYENNSSVLLSKNQFPKFLSNFSKFIFESNSVNIDYMSPDLDEKNSILTNFANKANLLNILENLLQEELFKDINKEKCKENVINLIETETNGNYNFLDFSTIKERLRKVLAVELLSGLTADFSKEERKKFNKAIKRRPLFK